MPLHDLLQAVPGLVLVVLIPGYLLATVLVPSWMAWQRLAGAPGLSAGLLGVLGLGMRLVHVPFEAKTVVPCVMVLAIAALLRSRLARPAPAPRVPRWLPVPALIAGVAGAASFAWALSGQVLPPDVDPRVHGYLAAAIARTHDVLPLIPSTLEGSAFAYARPGFEAMAAAVSWFWGPSPAQSMTPIITVVLVLLPLGLTLLALEATGSIALAAVVPLVAVGMIFPSFEAIVGRFPQVVDSTLVVPLIVAAIRVVGGRQLFDNALLLVAATASIWVVHGLEVLTALVVGGALLAWTAFVALRRSGAVVLVRAVAVGLAVAAGAALVTVLTRLPHGPTPTVVETLNLRGNPPPVPLHLHELFQLVAQTDLVSPIAIALYCAGILALLIRRRMLWVLVAHVVLVVALADSLYWRHLGNLWLNVIYPYGDPDRLLGVQYWIMPLIFGAGLLGIADAVRRLARDRRLAVAATVGALAVGVLVFVFRTRLDARYTALFGTPTIAVLPVGVFDGLAHLAPWRIAVAAAGVAMALAWGVLCLRGDALPPGVRRRIPLPSGFGVAAAAVAVVALVSLAVGARSDLDVYRRAVAERSTATPADLAVLSSMSARLPAGTVVFTDALTDAGIWLGAMTDLTPLVPPGSENGPFSLPLVEAVANACADPAEAVAALQNVDAVFVGSHHVPGTANQWEARCIARLPGVRQIAAAGWQGGEAVGFAVTH